jgi:hypothetical protein
MNPKWQIWLSLGNRLHHRWSDEAVNAPGDKWLIAVAVLTMLVVCSRTQLAGEIVRALGGR